jgi:hypothetical protein
VRIIEAAEPTPRKVSPRSRGLSGERILGHA